MGDDVQVDVGGLGHEALDGHEVEIFSQAMECGASEDGLRDAVFGDVGGGGRGDVFCGEMDDLRTQILRELDAGFECSLAFGRIFLRALDMDNVEFAAKAFGEACAAGDKVASLRTGADEDGNFFGDGPVRA